MPKRVHIEPPTEEEIMRHSNVPYELAAKYIGWSDITVRHALQQGRAQFGVAAENKVTHTWSYNISPGLLVKYKNGELPAHRLKDVLDIAAYVFSQVMGQRLDEIEKRLEDVEVSA